MAQPGSRAGPAIGGTWHRLQKPDRIQLNYKHSLIYRLAPETWALIFEFLLVDNPNWRRAYVNPHPPHFVPILLTKICRYWRDVAIVTRVLWSIIRVTFGHSTHPESMRRKLSLITLFLSRSGSAPLELHVQGRSLAETPHPIMDLLTTEMHRWSEINFDLPLALFPRLPRDRESPCLPLLRSLQCDVSTHTSNSFVDLFEGAANLRSMTLLTFPAQILIPYWNLTHLYFLYLPLDSACTILDLCRAIVHCSLYRCDGRPRGGLRPMTSNLRSLCMNFDESLDIKLVFQALTLPSLTSIEIDGSFDPKDRAWRPEDLVAMLDRSACSLESLVLTQTAISETEMIQCLKRVPSLVRFHVTARAPPQKRVVINDLLRLLTPNHQAPLGPALRHIALGGALAFHDSLLARMAESRWNPNRSPSVERLQSVEISVVGRAMDARAAGYLHRLGGRELAFVLRQDGVLCGAQDDGRGDWDPHEASRRDLEADECDAYLWDECDGVIEGLKARVELLNRQLQAAEEHRERLLRAAD